MEDVSLCKEKLVLPHVYSVLNHRKNPDPRWLFFTEYNPCYFNEIPTQESLAIRGVRTLKQQREKKNIWCVLRRCAHCALTIQHCWGPSAVASCLCPGAIPSDPVPASWIQRREQKA